MGGLTIPKSVGRTYGLVMGTKLQAHKGCDKRITAVIVTLSRRVRVSLFVITFHHKIFRHTRSRSFTTYHRTCTQRAFKRNYFDSRHERESESVCVCVCESMNEWEGVRERVFRVFVNEIQRK